MADIVIDTYKLKLYADRLANVNSRIGKLDRRIDGLYCRVGLQGLWDLLQADILTNYSLKLNLCQLYLLQTASDFEKVERELSSEDPTHFNKIILSDFIEILSPSLLVNYSLNLVSTIVSDRMQIDSDVWKQIQKQILKLPEDVKLAGDSLKWIEKLYDKTPDWLTHGFDVFLPETLKDAYTITSGLLQGNIKMDECWDVAKNIFSSNPKYAIVCETVEYVLDKGEKRSKEMERQMLEQLKEGDILGTVFEGAEGFVDTIIGGTIEVLGDVAGNAVDEIPVVKNISQFVEYGTGVFGLNDGDGYSLGGLIGQTGESIAEGIDGITDVVTDATDIVTDAVTGAIKTDINWVTNLFD